MNVSEDRWCESIRHLMGENYPNRILYFSMPRQSGVTTFLIRLANENIRKNPENNILFFAHNSDMVHFVQSTLNENIDVDTVDNFKKYRAYDYDLILCDNAMYAREFRGDPLQFCNMLQNYIERNTQVLWIDTVNG